MDIFISYLSRKNMYGSRHVHALGLGHVRMCPASLCVCVCVLTLRPSQVISPPGFYGNGSGYLTPCSAGYYGSSYGAASSTCDGPCLQGYYCPLGSPNATAVVRAL